ncbi:MAG: YraN family protein [bacterium]
MTPSALARTELGSAGEELAAEFLVRKGYKIHIRNLRLRIGEIDLLCLDGETMVVVEVKTQSSADFSDPVFKVDAAKQRKLQQLARAISARYPDRNVRVDVVTVVWPARGGRPKLTHLENVI